MSSDPDHPIALPKMDDRLANNLDRYLQSRLRAPSFDRGIGFMTNDYLLTPEKTGLSIDLSVEVGQIQAVFVALSDNGQPVDVRKDKETGQQILTLATEDIQRFYEARGISAEAYQSALALVNSTKGVVDKDGVPFINDIINARLDLHGVSGDARTIINHGKDMLLALQAAERAIIIGRELQRLGNQQQNSIFAKAQDPRVSKTIDIAYKMLTGLKGQFYDTRDENKPELRDAQKLMLRSVRYLIDQDFAVRAFDVPLMAHSPEQMIAIGKEIETIAGNLIATSIEKLGIAPENADQSILGIDCRGFWNNVIDSAEQGEILLFEPTQLTDIIDRFDGHTNQFFNACDDHRVALEIARKRPYWEIVLSEESFAPESQQIFVGDVRDVIEKAILDDFELFEAIVKNANQNDSFSGQSFVRALQQFPDSWFEPLSDDERKDVLKNIFTPVLKAIQSVKGNGCGQKEGRARVFTAIAQLIDIATNPEESRRFNADNVKNYPTICKYLDGMEGLFDRKNPAFTDSVDRLLRHAEMSEVQCTQAWETCRAFYSVDRIDDLVKCDWSNIEGMINRLGVEGAETIDSDVLAHELLCQSLGDQYDIGALESLQEARKAEAKRIADEQKFVDDHLKQGWVEVRDINNLDLRVVARPVFGREGDHLVSYRLSSFKEDESIAIKLLDFNTLHKPVTGSGPFVVAQDKSGFGEFDHKDTTVILLAKPNESIGESVTLTGNDQDAQETFTVQLYRDQNDPEQRWCHVVDNVTGKEEWLNVWALIDRGLTYKGHIVEWDFADGQHGYHPHGLTKPSCPIHTQSKAIKNPASETKKDFSWRGVFAKAARFIGFSAGAYLALSAIDLAKQGMRVDPIQPDPDEHTRVLPATPAPPVVIAPAPSSPVAPVGAQDSNTVSDLVAQSPFSNLKGPYQSALTQAGPDALTDPSIQLRVLVDVATANPSDVQASVALAAFLMENAQACEQNPAFCARHLVNTVYVISQSARAGSSVDRVRQLAMAERAVVLSAAHGSALLQAQAESQRDYLKAVIQSERERGPERTP